MSLLNRQLVLVLCGVVGSGKSTFAKALEQYEPRFVRCNQDDLGGDRRNVEILVRRSLSAGKSVCVDRTNIDLRQRRNWINIAREMNHEVWCVQFNTPLDICRERLLQRTDHPTIKSPEEALRVLSIFSSTYQAPSLEEGFHFLFTISPHATPTYTATDIEAILQSWESSAVPPPDLSQGPLPLLSMDINNDGTPRANHYGNWRRGTPRQNTYPGADPLMRGVGQPVRQPSGDLHLKPTPPSVDAGSHRGYGGGRGHTRGRGGRWVNSSAEHVLDRHKTPPSGQLGSTSPNWGQTRKPQTGPQQ